MSREAIIGTSDVAEEDVALDSSLQELAQEMPTLYTVEAHVQRLRYDLCGDAHASSGYAARVNIPASDLTRIASLLDLLDQLRHWAVEEGTTFVEEPSRLAEAEAPEAVVACACSGRPQLMTQALSVVLPMLRHPQTAWEVHRVVREVQREKEMTNGKNREKEEVDSNNTPERNEDTQHPANCDPLLLLLANMMAHHVGAATLLSEVMNTATAVVQAALSDLARSKIDETVLSRVHSIVETLYTTPLVFYIESAMQRFAEVAQLQLSGVQFFAAMVDLPTLTEGANSLALMHGGAAVEEDDDHHNNTVKYEALSSPSMADVVAHSDGVLEVLQRAMQLHRPLLPLCRGVLHIWCLCARLPSCRVSLLRHGVYGAALQTLNDAGPYSIDVFREAAEILGYFIPLLDVLQRRSLLLTLRGILQRRSDLEMIELVLALLVAVLTVVSGRNNQEEPQRHVNVNNNGRSKHSDPYAMYAMCPQPPTSSPPALTRDAVTTESTGAPRLCRLQLSPLFWQPSSSTYYSVRGNNSSSPADRDTLQFMLQQCALPQLVSGLQGYFSVCEVVDEKDAAEVQRVVALAEAVLTFF